MIGHEYHFFDSGAFSIAKKALVYYQEHEGYRWAYYDKPEFWTYMEKYVQFVKQYKDAFDLYANVDVIGNPELTWRNQQWLEKRGLTPVPVIHYPSDMKWLKHYIEHGYEMVGFGLIKHHTFGIRDNDIAWLDKAFDFICCTPDRIPKIKVHDFGVTAFRVLRRYPWYSCDSTRWIRDASVGDFLVPSRKANVWNFDKVYRFIASASPRKKDKYHWDNLTSEERRLVHTWLDTIKVPLGNQNESGVQNNNDWRAIANARTIDYFASTLPKWPWPYKQKRKSLW
jgi:hypothetical protein